MTSQKIILAVGREKLMEYQSSILKMKKIVSLIVFIVFLFNVRNVKEISYAKDITTSKKNITIKVEFATKKKIKLKFTNKGKKDFYFSGNFILKKFERGKWKRIQFKEDALFPKTMIVKGNNSIIVEYKWKKFFNNNLSKGKYKLKWVKNQKINIK